MADANDMTRQKLLQRWGHLKTERSSWWAHWMEISRYLLPRSGRYFRTDRNRGVRRDNNIYDSTGTRALRILGAGMMAGATSPARPWFRLGTPDPQLNAYQPVKLWLAEVAERMRLVFQKSNTYRALHQVYEELGAFGTASSIILPDYDTVIHHYPQTIGEYAIATDWKGRVCTLYREFEKPVAEVVKEFGLENCSAAVRGQYEKGQLDTWVPIVHAIEPRADRDPRKRNAANMPWGSWYFELGAEEGHILRESGFRRFPAVCPRWAVQGGDIYGNSPGMESLGDLKQLQHEQLSKGTAIEYKLKPPVVAPTSMKGRELNFLPGGVSYYEPTLGVAAVKPAYEVNLEMGPLLEDIHDVRQRIFSTYFADMFLMLSQSNDPKMTATEVAERHEEKMLMLGPVVERLSNELLYPMIEITFSHMLEAGAIPPAPQEMQGMELNVEFISMLAQAQQAIGTNSVDRFIGSLGVVAQIKPDVLDKFDADAWVDVYSDDLGIDPSLIVASDQVAVIRQARAKAQAAQQQAAAMEQTSVAAKNLAQAPTGGQPNALQDMLNQYSGYGSPSGVEV